MGLPYCARRHDPVGHAEELALSVAGFGIGLAIGLATIGVGLIESLTGVGAPVGIPTIILGVIEILALGETSSSIAGLLKEVLPLTPTGNINEGARTVFVGEARKEFSRVRDKVECQETMANLMAKATILTAIGGPLAGLAYGAYLLATGIAHEHSEIKSGSSKVIVEGQEGARVSSKTTCDGEVIDGEHTVCVYGKNYETGLEVTSTVPAAWSWAMTIISYAGFVGGIAKIFKQGIRVAGFKSMKDIFKVLRAGLKEELKSKRLAGKFWWGLNFLLGNPVVDKMSQMVIGKDNKALKRTGWGVKGSGATETALGKLGELAESKKVLLKILQKK